MQTLDKNTTEITQEFNSHFSSAISPKIKTFNKKRFILAVEGLVSLIIPAVMAYIFFVLEHPATPKDTETAILTIVVCGSILPVISLFYYFCPEKIKEESEAAKNLIKIKAFNKALYEHGEACSEATDALEEQVLSLFRIKKSTYISQLKQGQLIEKFKNSMIFPHFDRITRFNARITLGGLFVLKNTNDIGTKYKTTRNGCSISLREHSFYSNKPNDYYLVLLLGGFILLSITNLMASNLNQIMLWIGYIFSISLLAAYIIMIFVNSADQYKGVVVEIKTPEKIYDGHAILLEADDKHKASLKKLIREVKSPLADYTLHISKTNPPNVLSAAFFTLISNIRENFKPKYLRISIQDNSLMLFMKTSARKFNIFDWTKDMENAKAYEPFINRLSSIFNMADFLSKKS